MAIRWCSCSRDAASAGESQRSYFRWPRQRRRTATDLYIPVIVAAAFSGAGQRPPRGSPSDASTLGCQVRVLFARVALVHLQLSTPRVYVAGGTIGSALTP